jgi:hypothetical protein
MLNFSPVSVQSTVYYSSSISLLFHYTTQYITHALFFSCFSTQHCISLPLYFSLVSVHNPVYPHTLFPSCFSTQHCISPTLSFSPVLVHNTLYSPRSISPLFQYTTLFINHALFLSCFSTQHCIIAHYTILCCFKHTAVGVSAAFYLLFRPYF